MQQKSSDKIWKDESGMEIPYSRITGHERLCERETARALKKAIDIHKRLADFKTEITDVSTKLYESLLEENDINRIGKGKGGATFFNFDRSIKIEVSVNEQIVFDDNLIKLAKEKLDDFIASNVTGVESFIKDLIMSAFETSRGRLDTKKILALKKHAARIKDQRYKEAMELIDKSIRRPDSKTYFRIWEKDREGKYQSIDLNFSSI